MRKFVLTVVLFLLGAIALLEIQGIALNNYTTPFWGNRDIFMKTRFLKTKSGFSMMYIGSSLTYRHINPEVVDSVTSLRSFNLGAAGMENPETWYVVEKVIDYLSKRKKPDYLVIEVQGFGHISKRNLRSSKSIYYQDHRRFLAAQENFFNHNWTDAHHYFLTFLSNELKWDGVMVQMRARNENEERFQERKSEIGQMMGYYPLDFETERPYLIRNEAFQSDPSELTERTNQIAEEYAEGTTDYTEAELDLNYRIAELCRSNGIEPIFLKPPRKTGILGLFNALEDVHKIDLANPAEFPEFYDQAYSFDRGHMTSEGAHLFSLTLAERIKVILENGDGD